MSGRSRAQGLWSAWLVRPWRLALFLPWMTVRVLVANMRVVQVVLGPGSQRPPVVIALRTATRTDGELSVLGILISLTPGTLVLATDRSPADSVLYVYTTLEGPESLLESVTEIESRLLHAVRREGFSRGPDQGRGAP
jgi:multicomponent Na+:H+ antiporter subunit E